MKRGHRLETESIVIGYAMSRLDEGYLQARSLSSWKLAFAEAGQAMGESEGSFKNLRDEFDPIHPNIRAGWNQRPMRPNRLQVAADLSEVSDDALLELVARIIRRDEEATAEAVDVLDAPRRGAYNVAERLLTGRRAEEYFLENCRQIADVALADIEDFRQAARGFDFGVRPRPELAIEVKGLKEKRGDIQFTDREWSEAGIRGESYWLVVVGNLVETPIPRVFRNPHESITARCSYQKTIAASWRSSISVE